MVDLPPAVVNYPSPICSTALRMVVHLGALLLTAYEAADGSSTNG